MLRLSAAEVELFAAASGDRNPLHCSPAYARATAFGAAIAHGVLGAIAAATALPERPGAALKRIALEFPRPIRLDTDYAVEVREDGPDACSIEVREGSRPVLRGVLEFGPAMEVRVTGSAKLREVAVRRQEFTRGETVSGRYGPGLEPGPQSGLEPLLRRFPLASKGIAPAQVLALALCSYVIGMELPGELALFTKLVLDFDERPGSGPLGFEATVRSWQPRTRALRIGLELRVGDQPWARGSLRAFVQAAAEAGADEPAPISERLAPDAFAGKTALIIGASRGLGRSLARSFAAHGGEVWAVARSPLAAEARGRDLPASAGAIHPLELDAGDPVALAAGLEQLERLDLLACNASPPLQAMRLEPATAARIHEHIAAAVALISAPLAIALPRLAAAGGVALLSSSRALDAPPSEWAHYVAAKRAAESLFEVAAAQYPEVGFLIARMPRLATAFTLNVSGEPAASPRSVALRLLERLAERPPAPGRVERITDFADDSLTRARG